MTGENYESSDEGRALEKLAEVKQERLDDLGDVIRDGGSDYYKQAGELLQKVLKTDKIRRWSVEKMLDSSFVKGGSTVSSKKQLLSLVDNVTKVSGTNLYPLNPLHIWQGLNWIDSSTFRLLFVTCNISMGLLFAAGKLDEATKEMKQLHDIMKTLQGTCMWPSF